MRTLAALAVALTLAAPAGALRTPDALPSELLANATVVIPTGLHPREAPQRLALRVLSSAEPGTQISFLQLYVDGETLCKAHPDVPCYPAALGRIWYVRLVTRTVAQRVPPEEAAVPQRTATVIAVDGGRMLRKPPTD
jgi:hypothetical protein